MSASKPVAHAEGKAGAISTSPLYRPGACGVVIVDAKGRITHCTGVAAGVLGLGARQISDKHYRSLPSALSKVIRRTITSGKPVDGFQFDLTIVGHGKRSLAASTAPLGRPGQKRGAALVVNDLTSLVQADQNLRQLDRLAALGTVSASLAPDIRKAGRK